MIGKTVSHYNILEKLGEGGMGVVYKAEDTKLKRTVALKFLPPEFMRDSEAKERFLHEAQAAAALEHQNICNIYEINETEDQIFIVMSCFEGQTLKEKIESGPLKIDETLKIAIQAAEGLQAAHEREIIHRDIKSANIMVTGKGLTKIMDFGLAKLKGQTKITKEGSTLGTAAYMSPEQAQGADVDHRTDIWSLGVVLYEMVTGQLPFRGEYEQAVVYSIINEEPEAITGLRTGLPVELERIINKALVKDPSDRYQHVDEMKVDLRKLKKDSKQEVTVSKKKTRPETTLKASWKMLILVSIFLAVIIMVGGYFIFKEKPETETPVMEPGGNPSLAVVYFENKSGDERLDNWRDAFSQLLTTDLSQSRYLKVLRSDEIYSIFKKLNLLEVKKYSSENLWEIAKRGRVNHILKGSYIKAGDNFVITATLINADSGETISSLSVKAEGEKNIFPKVDELTREIKSKLKLNNDRIAGDVDRDVAKITTWSPEAYKYYAKGRKYHHAGYPRKSIQLMEKAIAIDPEFAMAYRSMGTAYGNLQYHSESMKYFRKAMELSHRLSDRERYNIQGDFYRRSEKNYDKAIKTYNKLLQLYPLDSIGNTNLGILYDNLEEWDKAIERYEVLIRNKDPDFFPYSNINYTYQVKGWYQKAKEVLEYYINNFQDHWLIRSTLAENYIIQKKFDHALSEAEKAISLAPIIFPYILKGDIFLFQGDFLQAEKFYRKLLDSKEITLQFAGKCLVATIPLVQGRYAEAELQLKQALKLAKEYGLKRWQASSHQLIGYMYFLSKRYEEAVNEFNEALKICTEMDLPYLLVAVRYWKAVSFLEMNAPNQVQKAEEELLKCVKKRKNRKLIRLYYLFKGNKEMKRNNFSKAIEYFNKALSLLPYQNYGTWNDRTQALFINSLARAYSRSGDMDRACEEYEKISSLTVGRCFLGDIYAKAFYNLGKIYQQKGFKGKAIESYNKFINLWKDCDPQFHPMLEDARKRIKELEE